MESSIFYSSSSLGQPSSSSSICILQRFLNVFLEHKLCFLFISTTNHYCTQSTVTLLLLREIVCGYASNNSESYVYVRFHFLLLILLLLLYSRVEERRTRQKYIEDMMIMMKLGFFAATHILIQSYNGIQMNYYLRLLNFILFCPVFFLLFSAHKLLYNVK